jgi:gephyrin
MIEIGRFINTFSIVASRPRMSPYPLTPVGDALALVHQYAQRLEPVTVALNSNLIGAVVAEDILACENVPNYRASVMDGYALNAADGAGVMPVHEFSAMAGTETFTLPAGHIARIATGGPLPEGANAVVPIEQTKLIRASADGHTEELVEILHAAQPGEFVREIGSDFKAGDVILKAGDVITEVGGEIGLLASCNVQHVVVYRRPVVGVMSTGNEVVDADATTRLLSGQIRDTNRPSLLAAVRAAGFECIDLGIVPDHAESLESALHNAIDRVDVLITTGGVSMGDADLLKSILERRLRATIHFGRVLMKPGKPTTFATIPGRGSNDRLKLVFALPALRRMSGHTRPDLPVVRVQLLHDIVLDTRPEYHRAVVRVREDGLGLCAASTGDQRSSRVASIRGANALLRLPLAGENGVHTLSRGDTVEAILIGRIQ